MEGPRREIWDAIINTKRNGTQYTELENEPTNYNEKQKLNTDPMCDHN